MEIKWKDLKKVKENNPEIDTIDQAIDEAVKIKRREMWEEMYNFLSINGEHDDIITIKVPD